MNLKLLKICASVFLVLAPVGAHYYFQYKAVQEAVERTTSDLKAQYDKSLREQEKRAQEASNDLQRSADKKLEEKDAKLKTINSRLDGVLSELRNRPERPSPEALATHTIFGQACTARELYREDAEFLAREAARADTVVAERDYYYEQYEAVRKKINGTTE